LIYKVRETSGTIANSFERFYLFIIIWLFAATVLKIFSYGFSWIEPLSFFFRVLNGFAVFAVFPLIFKDRKSINSLVNAFFIATFFPLAQGLIQLIFGANIGGMRSSISDGSGSGNYEMYYGLYFKYGGYAWAALCGGLIMIYKMGIKIRIDRKREFIYGGLFILYLVLASMTLSRVLIFSMAVVIATIFITIRATNAGFLLIAAVLIVAALTISGSGYVKSRYQQVMDRSEREFQVVSGEADAESAFHGRGSLWKSKLDEFNQRPFIERLSGTNISTGPHSDYVQWLLQYGYIGIILYILLFPVLLVCSVRMLFRTKDSYLRPYGFMVVAGLIVWLMEAIIHNSSQMPDYSYFIIGNAAVFLSAGKNMLNQDSSSSAFQLANMV
ncbi:MAG: O-antigen ligase family protein, partial [Sedimentisphaerales bacterium]